MDEAVITMSLSRQLYPDHRVHGMVYHDDLFNYHARGAYHCWAIPLDHWTLGCHNSSHAVRVIASQGTSV